MKSITCILAAGLLVCSLTACGAEKVPAPTKAPEDAGSLLLVETKPPVTTVPETQPETTLPDFLTKPSESPETAQTAPTEKAPETQLQKKPSEEKPEEKSADTAKPKITKQPTGETVQEGKDAWFVAHAEGSKSVRWQFLSQDNQVQTPEQVAILFPDLKVEGLESDTLILKNVCSGTSGWSLRAEFQGEGGTAVTDAAPLTVVTAPAGEAAASGDALTAYASVIENCKFIQRYDPNSDSPDLLDQNDPYQLRQGLDLMGGGLGYALQDLDNNGVQELIIGCPGSNNFGERGDEMVFALFTLQNNTPIKLAQSWSRNRNYLSKDNFLYCEGSNSASNSTFTMLRVDGTKLVTAASLWNDGYDQNGNMRAYYSPEGIPDDEHSRRVHDERFYELQSGMIASRRPLPELTDILAWQ